jgi:hypothetical protein
VIVVSDHGEEFFDHGRLGHRHTLYEESIRVPLLLRLPAVLPADVSVRGPVSLTDVVPTVLDILGLPGQDHRASTSFLPMVRSGADGADRSVLARLVMMYEGQAHAGAGDPITFRQVVVQDVFRTGPIKITRTRSWPQLPSALPPDLQEVLSEAAAQYAREQLRWIDIERFPERDEEHVSDFWIRRTQRGRAISS